MNGKRLLASLLTVLLLLALLPAAALAEESAPAETEAVLPPGQPKTLNYGYYLIGRYGWTVDDLVESRDMFQQNYSAATEEYKLSTTLEEGQQIKVVLVSNSTQLGPWYPSGDFNYTVDAAHAGTKIIYFRPTYNADWAEFGGYIYITDPPVYHVYFNQPAHGYLAADKTEATEGETVNITPHPDPGYYPNTIKSNDWPPQFINPDAYHASFTMPANDVTVYMMWDQFVVESGFYYSVGINVQELSPEQKFQEENSPFGEYVYEAVLEEGDYFSLTRIFTEQGWSHNGILRDPDMDWTITPEMAGHVKIYLTETEREGYTKIFEYSQWTTGSSDVWMTLERALPITVDPNIAHGTVSAPADAFKDESVTLTVTPAEGYELDTLTVVDEEGLEISVEGNSFTMPDMPVTVTAAFKPAEVEQTVTLSFDAGEGTVEPATKEVNAGEAIGELPVPTREGGWEFLGWYTTPAETAFNAGQGTQVTAETIIEDDTTVYAHWRLPGDVNGDGKVNLIDAQQLMRYVKYHDVTVVEANLDITGDGKVNLIDAQQLMRYAKYHDVEIH